MDADTLARLRRPFDRSMIKQRVGPGGRTLTYAPIGAYLERLLEAFGGAFSIEVTRHELLDEEVIVDVRIEAGGTVKTAIGGAPITRRRDNGKPVSLAHDFMAAEAVATKRACRGFGVGLELYDDAEDHDEVTASASSPRSPSRLPPESQRESPRLMQQQPAPRQAPGPERNRLTSKQHGAIRSIAREHGYADNELRKLSRRRYGVELDFLSRGQASDLINALSTNGLDRQPGQEG